MDFGQLSNNGVYPVTVFFAEVLGNDFIQISYQNGNGTFLTSWDGMLLNLPTGMMCTL